MILNSEINDIAKVDLREAQRIAWDAVGVEGKRRFFELKGRQACAERAKAKPLPGASADAFIRGATKVAGESIREVLPIHLAALQAVESPILKMVENAIAAKDKKSNEDFNEAQEWEICHIFTCEPKQLRKDLKDSGADKIKSDAEEKIQDWTAAKIQVVILAIVEQFHRHIKTTVKFAAEMEGQVSKSFFQELNQTPKPEASAGS